MPNPSLLIVPARFKTGRLYSQIPSNTDNRGDFNVTRATAATRVNSAGLIESVASGIPRLDYFESGGTVACPALLIEPAATNFARGIQLLNTPTPATASGGITITTGSTDFLAPDGSSGTITKYVGGTASGNIFIEYASSTSVSASGVHTFSAFVKTGATNPLTFCALQFSQYTAASGTATSYFNLASGTALTAGATIQNYGNGWYRIISAPYTIAAGDLAGSIRLIFAEADNDINWPASGALNLTLYAWGIQLEAGSIATSYIPTTTGSITRNADVVSVSGAVSGSIGQQSGTIYIECQSGFATNDIIVINTAGQSPGNNYVAITKTATNVFRLSLIASGTTILIDQASAITSFAKIAVAYASGNTALFINGTQIGSTDTTGFSFNAALNNITFISNMVSGTKTTRIRAVALYTERLTNDQLASLTTP